MPADRSTCIKHGKSDLRQSDIYRYSCLWYDVKLFRCYPGHDCGHDYVSRHVDKAVSGGMLPAGKGVKVVCKADIARTFEFVLHFVMCNMVRVTKPDYYHLHTYRHTYIQVICIQ